MMRAGQERENAGNDERAGKQPDHRPLMAPHILSARMNDRQRQHDKREDR